MHVAVFYLRGLVEYTNGVGFAPSVLYIVLFPPSFSNAAGNLSRAKMLVTRTPCVVVDAIAITCDVWGLAYVIVRSLSSAVLQIALCVLWY